MRSEINDIGLIIGCLLYSSFLMARRGFNSDEVELQLIALAVRAYKAAKLHF